MQCWCLCPIFHIYKHSISDIEHQFHTNIRHFNNIIIYIYIHTYVCVCVRVYMMAAHSLIARGRSLNKLRRIKLFSRHQNLQRPDGTHMIVQSHNGVWSWIMKTFYLSIQNFLYVYDTWNHPLWKKLLKMNVIFRIFGLLLKKEKGDSDMKSMFAASRQAGEKS